MGQQEGYHKDVCPKEGGGSGQRCQTSADQDGSQLQVQVQQKAGVRARYQVLDGKAVTAKGGAALDTGFHSVCSFASLGIRKRAAYGSQT